MKRVREVSNGREALDELRRQKADLLITDWHMPGISGLKLLQLIRQDEDLKDIPVLMVTARSNREDVIAAAQGGVNHYIVKPFDAKTLAEKLTRIFSPSDAGED
jgi:two-component system chemotaxis response regulator CheY